MKSPNSKEEVIQVVNQHHKWLASNGNTELFPTVLDDKSLNPGMVKILAGMVIHTILFLIRYMARKLRIWHLVGICAYLRIKTDGWSVEPRQCGYNDAYTLLGLYRLRRNNVSGAISALNESWHVWPCPHNTSFGLRKALVRKLEEYPEAAEAVEQYLEVANAFKA